MKGYFTRRYRNQNPKQPVNVYVKFKNSQGNSLGMPLEGITVGVVEPLFGNRVVISNNYPYKKVDAFTIRFDVTVPKDGEVKVKYRIRVGM